MGMTVRDFEEINQLSARYCHAVDFGDFDGVVSVFAPDGSFEVSSDPGATRRGEQQLRRSIGARDGKGHVRHTALIAMIDGDGVTARSLSPVLITQDFGPPVGRGQATQSNVVAMGLYIDDLVRVDGRWVYARRLFTGRGGEHASNLLGVPLEIDPVDAGEARRGMSALDYEAIRQLLARVDYTLDFEDYDGFADCFIGDGLFHEVTRQDGRPETRLAAHGRQELWQLAVYESDIGYRGHVHHGTLSVLIEGDGERARVSSYALITQDHGPPPQPRQHGNARVRMTGMYRDEVVKVDGRWLIARRTFRKDTLPEVDALVGRPLDFALFGDEQGSGAYAPLDPSSTFEANGADGDAEGIRQLFARYSQTLDFGDAEGFASCFTADGVLDTSRPEEDLAGVHRGRDALQAFASTAVEYSAGRARESALNSLIDTDGATAKASSYTVVTRAFADATNPHGKPSQVTHSDLITTGMYFDELVKVDGRWLFSRRQFRHDGLPDMMERLHTPVTVGPRS